VSSGKYNYQPGAMDERIHYDITRRLDAMKTRGLISDYWVSWVGSSGDLQPKVCSWITGSNGVEPVREHVALVLNGLVASEHITVKADELCGNG
jgi:hypothetical protein